MKMGRATYLDIPDPDGLCRRNDVVSDGFTDLKIHNFFFNQILQIGNYNSSEYEGLEFTLRRRLHRKWQMEANYTYSEVVGAAKDFASELGNDPANTEEEFGPLDFDQRHSVKLSALTHLPKDFMLSGIVTANAVSGIVFRSPRRIPAQNRLLPPV